MPNLRGRSRGLLALLFVGLLILFLVEVTRIGLPGRELELDSMTFLDKLQKGEIDTIRLKGDEISGDLAPGGTHSAYQVRFPAGHLQDPEYFSKHILEPWKKSPSWQGVDPAKAGEKFRYDAPNVFLTQILLPLVPWFLLVLLVYYFFFRQLRTPGGPGGILSFGRSRAKLAGKEQRRATFNDVAGIDEAREEVQEIIEFLRDPQKFRKLGARIPRGVLMVGPPGAGKTLLAKAIAGEARVPFLNICGSDFVEMFVGVGASRVRDLFRQAREAAPAIIFLDEIDAVGRRRGSGLGGGHDEREQTLNQILVEMDGFATDEEVIVIAATNRPDVLDPALLRPGRFDREIVVDLPDVKGREAIFQVHARKIKLDGNINLELLARTTPMFSGADIEAVVNEAALLAVMRKKEAVGREELEEARDKVRWGREKRSRVLDELDRKITSYHESGHALLSKLLPGVEAVHKITIIPRGPALGATMRLPDKDRYHMQKQYVLNTMIVMMGGRVAEELFCNDISAGAKNDIKEATDLARQMICEWGMSEKLGPVNYSENEEHIFLGREIARSRNHSEETANAIDREVRLILDRCYLEAKSLLERNRRGIEAIALALLKREVISGQEMEDVLKEVPLVYPDGHGASGTSPIPHQPAAAGDSPERARVEGFETRTDKSKP